MMLFETMGCIAADDILFEKVRKYQGKEWGTHLKFIKQLRTRYLHLQEYRCVYCQGPIEADANGYRELEHILPKSEAGESVYFTNNDLAHRRSTRGYAEFTFEPLNLCISCKVCNTKKGTFDPLLDRTRPVSSYPSKGDFCWFHPHYERYSSHIRISSEFTFTQITVEGGTVIDICGLADPESLAQRFASRAEATTVRNAKATLQKLLNTLSSDIAQKKYGMSHAVAELVTKRDLDAATASSLVQVWCDYAFSDCDVNLLGKANQATAFVVASLKP